MGDADPGVAVSAPAPQVRLGAVDGESIAVSIFALVERGVMLRPDLARELRASIVLRFPEGYSPVRIDLMGEEISVSDSGEEDRAQDLVVEGALPDVAA